jgi:hypothetical protein
VFAGIYRGHGLRQGDVPVNLLNDGPTALYFSIVTWTMLGYGDFTPKADIRLIAALETIIGYGYLAVVAGLVSETGQSIAPNSRRDLNIG